MEIAAPVAAEFNADLSQIPRIVAAAPRCVRHWQTRRLAMRNFVGLLTEHDAGDNAKCPSSRRAYHGEMPTRRDGMTKT
jgi:hypothetical protein